MPETGIVPIESAPIEARIAFQDFLDLGPERSILGLIRKYKDHIREDPTALVPSVDFSTISNWEKMYNWKKMAFEWDAEEHEAYIRMRNSVLGGVYQFEQDAGKLAMGIGKFHMERLNQEGAVPLSPLEALKFVTEGARLRREAAEKEMAMKDPAQTQKSVSYMGQLRSALINFESAQIQNNYYSDVD